MSSLKYLSTTSITQSESYYIRKTLRIQTYKALIKEYPGLKDVRMMRLLMWCLLGKKDKHTGMPLVGSIHCNIAAGIKTTDNESLPILRKMQRILGKDNFAWSEYNRFKGECRVLTNFTLPHTLTDMLDEEFRVGGHIGRRVYLDGSPLDKNRTGRSEIDLSTEKDPKLALLKHPSQAEVLNYLNTLDNRFYEKIYSYNYPATWDAALALTKNREDCIGLLHCCWEDCERPFYALSENTYRVYAVGHNITQLPSEIRRLLCKGWYELDLKSAQLAIISRLWDIPTLRAFLESGQSFWTHCLTELNLEVNESNKKWLKELTYALAFGAGELSFKNICIEHEIDFSYYQVFRKIELVSEIFKARTRRMKFFRSNGYAHKDCYGYVTQVQPSEGYRLLAREAQSIEWLLMYSSVFSYVMPKSDKEIAVTLLQHDGCCLYMKRNQEKHLNNINAKLKEVTDRLSIPTYFECVKL